MHRQWLDWHRPLLPAAAAWLIGQHSDGKRCDLRQVRCVLPGTRAGKLLLVPPTPDTASALECTLAWMHVLREAPPEQIAALLPTRPDGQDWPAWHELAAQIGGIVEELAGELLSLRDVAKVAARMDMEREALRWAMLERLCDRYRERLRRCSRIDPHERRHQAVANLVDADTPVDPDYNLVLFGSLALRLHVVAGDCHAADEQRHSPDDERAKGIADDSPSRGPRPIASKPVGLPKTATGRRAFVRTPTAASTGPSGPAASSTSPIIS